MLNFSLCHMILRSEIYTLFLTFRFQPLVYMSKNDVASNVAFTVK